MNPLVGAWRLISTVSENEDGEVSNLGTNPTTVGYLIYSADGHMAAILMHATRPAFVAGDLRGGTPEEKLAAYDNVISYCGTYDVHDNTVVHHVEASSFPNWVGADQLRTFTLSGDELKVTTPPILIAGKKETGSLVFHRADASGPSRSKMLQPGRPGGQVNLVGVSPDRATAS
jgi:hypothetical protein